MLVVKCKSHYNLRGFLSITYYRNMISAFVCVCVCVRVRVVEWLVF